MIPDKFIYKIAGSGKCQLRNGHNYVNVRRIYVNCTICQNQVDSVSCTKLRYMFENSQTLTVRGREVDEPLFRIYRLSRPGGISSEFKQMFCFPETLFSFFFLAIFSRTSAESDPSDKTKSAQPRSIVHWKRWHTSHVYAGNVYAGAAHAIQNCNQRITT